MEELNLCLNSIAKYKAETLAAAKAQEEKEAIAQAQVDNELAQVQEYLQNNNQVKVSLKI